MALFKNKFKIKTWQELSASVAGDGTLSFKPIKKLPKKLQQGKHSYKTKKGWFRRQKIKELASLKDTSGDGELSEGFFIYDSEKSTSYAGYPKQQFNDDMMDMLGSQSFAASAFAQMSESFTSINWPDIVVIQEEYAQESASVQIGWDRVGVILHSENIATDLASGSVKFLNSSTNDIGMGQSFAMPIQSTLLNVAPFFQTSSHIHPHLEYTLPVTTASYKIVNQISSTVNFSCSFVLENLESPGYTASDGTINEAYTTQELAEAMEWKYTGSRITGESPILKQHNGKFVGFGDACVEFFTYDHEGNQLQIYNTEQNMKTQVFGDNPDEAPTQHPSTIAIFNTFGDPNRARVTSSTAYRFAYDDLSGSGTPVTTSLFYVTKGSDGIGLGKAGVGLGSYLFADVNLIQAALPGVYTFPSTSDYPSGPSNPYITTVTTSFNPLIRFSGSTV